MKPLGKFDIALCAIAFAYSVAWLSTSDHLWVRIVAGALIGFYIAVAVSEVVIRRDIRREREHLEDALLEMVAIDRILRDNGVRHSLDDVIAELGLEEGK